MALEQITFNIAAFNDADASGNNYFAGEIYEVFNANDTLADIYSDAAGANPINQDGISNKSNASGEVEFYIDQGSYYILSSGKHRDFKVVGGISSKKLTSNFLEFELLSSTDDQRIYNGATVNITDRGNAKFKIVEIASIGGAPLSGFEAIELPNFPDLAAILSNIHNNSKKPLVLAHWGGKKSDIGDNTIGFDNGDILQAMATYAKENAISIIKTWGGRYKSNKPVVVPSSNDGLGETTVTLQGSGENSTELFTTTNIDMMNHGKFFNIFDMSVVNRGLDGLTKYTGTATRCDGESWKCRTERVSFWWFEIAQVKRYSVWDSYRDLTYNDNLCSIKLARSSDMFDQNNPDSVGPWNRSDLNGWYHNKNTFDNIVFNGGKESNGGRGEIGFWGATEGCAFNNITVQNYERDGTIPNKTIPIGQVSTGFQLEGGGLTSTASQDNQINSIYFERVFKALKVVDQKALVINGFFTQGQTGGENLLEATRSTINITGQTNQSSGWSADIVAIDSNITIDKPIESAGGASGRVLTNSYLSENGVPIRDLIKTQDITITPEFSGTISVKTDADAIAYDRIGNYVPFTGRIDVLSVSTDPIPTGSYININGMPFSVGNATQRAGNASVSVTVFGGVNGTEIVPAILLENATAIRVFLSPTTMTGSEQFYISGHYFTTAFS